MEEEEQEQKIESRWKNEIQAYSQWIVTKMGIDG